MNQLPKEIIGHIFNFLNRSDLYGLLKIYPGFVSDCCYCIRFRLMYNFISELEYDNNHQPTYKSKRKKKAYIKRRHFRRGVEYWENSKQFTPQQTLMIYYPKKSLQVLFETVGPYLLCKINNWKPFGESDEKMIKKFNYHFYNIKLSLGLFESRICNSNRFYRTSFKPKSLETCLDITKVYKTRLVKLNTIIATEYLENLKREFHLIYTKLRNESQVDNEFLEVWNEKFKLIYNILSYSKSIIDTQTDISFIITNLWVTNGNLLDFLPLLLGLDRTNSSKRTSASKIILDICSSRTTISVKTAQDVNRIQNLLQCCSYFKYSMSEYKIALERFFDKMVVVPELKEELISLKTQLFDKYD